MDGNAAWNMAFSVFAGVTTFRTLAMSTGQKRDQVVHFSHIGMVDELVDRLGADPKTGVIHSKSPRDLLGGPSLFELGNDVVPDGRALQTLSSSCQAFPATSPFLSHIGSVTIIHGGSVTSQFP